MGYLQQSCLLPSSHVTPAGACPRNGFPLQVDYQPPPSGKQLAHINHFYMMKQVWAHTLGAHAGPFVVCKGKVRCHALKDIQQALEAGLWCRKVGTCFFTFEWSFHFLL